VAPPLKAKSFSFQVMLSMAHDPGRVRVLRATVVALQAPAIDNSL